MCHSPGGKQQHLRGGVVQPLNVIDGDKERLLFCQQSQDVEECSGNCKRFWRAVVWLGPAQRDLKCQPLRAGDLSERAQPDAIEQVSHNSEQKRRLGLAGPG